MVLSVKLSVACKVPPLRVSLLASTVTGAAPKKLSALTDKVPPLI